MGDTWPDRQSPPASLFACEPQDGEALTALEPDAAIGLRVVSMANPGAGQRRISVSVGRTFQGGAMSARLRAVPMMAHRVS